MLSLTNKRDLMKGKLLKSNLIGRDNGSKLKLIFYDSNNNELASISIPFDYVDLYNNLSIINSPFFYSIDLIDIPIVLLDKTDKIDMIKMVGSKNQINLKTPSLAIFCMQEFIGFR